MQTHPFLSSGSLIGVLQVYDLDKEQSPNSLLRYEIVNQEPKTPSATMFLIDNFMGKIQLGNSNLQKKEVPEYQLTIKVSDKAGDPTGNQSNQNSSMKSQSKGSLSHTVHNISLVIFHVTHIYVHLTIHSRKGL